MAVRRHNHAYRSILTGITTGTISSAQTPIVMSARLTRNKSKIGPLTFSYKIND